LRSDPIDGVFSVAGFLGERGEDTFRSVASANILNQDVKAVIDEGLKVGVQVGAFVIRSANQDGGKAASAFRPVEVGGEAHAVAHGDKDFGANEGDVRRFSRTQNRGN
jgi:hypothetical protein